MKKPIVKLEQEYGLFIDGEFVGASDQATFDASSPADGSHLAKVAEATI